jgi:tetratricopeptide (TPR) repeat protein
VQACPPSKWYRFGKFARRNRTALVSAAVLAAAVLLALGGLALSNARISAEAAAKAHALATAKASEQEAVESLKDALAAVDALLTRVSEERLQYVPQMEAVRRDLLRDALKFYQKFLARRGKDPAIRQEAALAYRRMGSLHFQLGDYRRAEDAYRKAFAVLDQLDAESPLEPGIRRGLVGYYIGFSWVLRNQGKFDEGEKALRRAVAVAEGLVKKSPEVASYREALVDASNRLADAIAGSQPKQAEKILRRNLTRTEGTTSLWDRARTYRSLGDLLTRQRRFSEAEDAYRQGVRLFNKAAAKSPARLRMPVDLAGTLRQLAKVVDARGRPQEAEEIYRRAIPLFDKLAADFPAGPHNRWGQAAVHFRHGLLLQKLKRSAEAEQEYRRTVELFDKLANDFPTLPGYAATAVDRRLHLAQFLAETGRAEEAQQVYDRAAAQGARLPAPQRAQALILRGHFHAGLGQWDKAAADFTRAIELGSDDIFGAWCALAVLHLHAGRTDDYRSLCERLLERFDRKESLWLVATCALAPRAVADLSGPVRIAEKLVARQPKNAEHLAILGFALYRKGDLEGAVRRLKASLRPSSGLREVHAAKLILAMACHRLGRRAQAQQLLREVTRWMDEEARQKGKEGAGRPVPLPWAYRLGLQLLRREAEELLKQDSGPRDRQSD